MHGAKKGSLTKKNHSLTMLSSLNFNQVCARFHVVNVENVLVVA